MRQDWPVWIKASIHKHIADILAGQSLYYEGERRDTNKILDYFELRIGGPFTTEISREYNILEVEINLLVTTTTTAISNMYQPDAQTGLAFGALTREIEIFKFGPEGTGGFLGCLERQRDRRGHEIFVYDLGLRDNVDVKCSVVEGRYRTEFSESEWE